MSKVRFMIITTSDEVPLCNLFIYVLKCLVVGINFTVFRVHYFPSSLFLFKLPIRCREANRIITFTTNSFETFTASKKYFPTDLHGPQSFRNFVESISNSH